MNERRRASRFLGRHVRPCASALATCAFASLGVACILADPPAQPATLPPVTPVILSEEVSPPTSQILGSFPQAFIVPVEVANPNETFSWRLYVDYDPNAPDNTLGAVGTSSPDSFAANQSVRVIEAASMITPPPYGCHTIEFLVALNFDNGNEGHGAHTPQPPGDDSVIWFYNPTGDLAGCAIYDAGAADAGGD